MLLSKPKRSVAFTYESKLSEKEYEQVCSFAKTFDNRDDIGIHVAPGQLRFICDNLEELEALQEKAKLFYMKKKIKHNLRGCIEVVINTEEKNAADYMTELFLKPVDNNITQFVMQTKFVCVQNNDFYIMEVAAKSENEILAEVSELIVDITDFQARYTNMNQLLQKIINY